MIFNDNYTTAKKPHGYHTRTSSGSVSSLLIYVLIGRICGVLIQTYTQYPGVRIIFCICLFLCKSFDANDIIQMFFFSIRREVKRICI